MTLKTRKPTGAVPWPLLLVEGGEKTGKTYTCALLAKSGKVGPMYWIDLGEGAADEYGAIPGVDYDIVEHDGSFGSIFQAVLDVREVAQQASDAKQKPVVLLIDGMNAEWDLLKDWATSRARSSRSNREKLARDPNAEIDVSQNYWNDANLRHRMLMTKLMTFPGIVLMTCRGKDVAAVSESGRPVEGKKDYRVEGQKNLGFDSSCWLRLYRDKPAIVVGARSVHHGLRPGIDAPRRLPDDWTIEWVVFDFLQCNPATAHVRDYKELEPDLTPEQIRDEALRGATTFERIRELHAITRAAYPDAVLQNDTGDDEKLLDLLFRIGNERRAAAGDAPAAPRAQQHPGAASAAVGAVAVDTEAETAWSTEFFTRLDVTETETQYRMRRSEVELAVAHQDITRSTADDLLAEIDKQEAQKAAA